MFIKNTAIHFLFSSLLPLVDGAGFLLASHIAFIDVLLTLLFPIVFTLGSLTEPGAGTFPLLFITAVLLVGIAAFIVWLEDGGTFVLLFLMFLLSLFFSSF